MATLTLVMWRDIPAQVIVKQGRKAVKQPLSERFEKPWTRRYACWNAWYRRLFIGMAAAK